MTSDAPSDTAEIVNWLLREGRFMTAEAAVAELFARIRAKGHPIDRVRLGFFLLHPTLFGVTYAWDQSSDFEIILHDYPTQFKDVFVYSPVNAIRTGAISKPTYFDLSADDLPYPLLHQLKDQGFTGYFLIPLVFQSGARNCSALATKAPGGFKSSTLDLLSALVDVTTQQAELMLNRLVTEHLLSTYLGAKTAKEVLSGRIQRGDGRSINAVIYTCDLRNFSTLSDERPLAQLLSLLDEYFEAVVTSIEAWGGEVLKFIGDAVLAIFPVDDECDAKSACQKAASAAHDALERVKEPNARRQEEGDALIEFGTALHLGEVMYGNIGSRDRLDFTVIGPAVNHATRIEGLCSRLGETILVSKTFKEHYDGAVESRGEHSLKGIRAPFEVYSLVVGKMASQL